MSKSRFDTTYPTARWMQAATAVLFALSILVPLIPTGAAAQTYGPSGGGGYGPSGGYGMMGGGGRMGGPEAQAQQLTLSQSMHFIEQSTASARVDKARNLVVFTGRRIFIAMAAVQPGFPDTTFEVGGLVDPTIEVPAGSAVTLLLINMDYGPDMDHGVVITDVQPPYPVMGMMGMPRALSGVPVLAPRDGSNAKTAGYAADSITFTTPQSAGDYYYLCQYRDHASKGMFGRFEVR